MDDVRARLRPTQDCVCSAYRKASRAVTQHYEAAFRGTGLRATQFTILSALAQTGPMPVSKVASFLGLERTTLTRNLTLLVERGLVDLRTGEDGRVRLVALTERGETAALDHLPLWKAAQGSVGEVLKRFNH